MKIFKKYNKSVLYEHYKNKTLLSLPSIGKKTEETIIEYFKKDKNISFDKMDEIESEYPYIHWDSDKISKFTDKDKDIIYENYEWLKTVNLRDNIKERLMKNSLYEDEKKTIIYG